jgi:hypothetical protein
MDVNVLGNFDAQDRPRRNSGLRAGCQTLERGQTKHVDPVDIPTFDWPAIRGMVEAPAYFARKGLSLEEVHEQRQRIADRLAGIEAPAAPKAPRRYGSRRATNYTNRVLLPKADRLTKAV